MFQLTKQLHEGQDGLFYWVYGSNHRLVGEMTAKIVPCKLVLHSTLCSEWPRSASLNPQGPCQQMVIMAVCIAAVLMQSERKTPVTLALKFWNPAETRNIQALFDYIWGVETYCYHC
jgi:hypothetical protein